MTYNELMEEIDDRIKIITNHFENPYPEYTFYKELSKNYNLKSITSMIEIPSVDIATALLFPLDIDEAGFDFDKTMEDIISFRNVFEELTVDELISFSEMLLRYFKLQRLEEIEAIFNYPNKEDAVELFRSSFKIKKDVTAEELKIADMALDIVTKLIKQNGENGWDISKFIHYYNFDPMRVGNIISIIAVIDEYYVKKDEIDFKSKKFIESKNAQAILKCGEGIYRTVKTLDELHKKEDKRLQNVINVYIKFKKDIEEAFKKDEIRNYENIISGLDDEDKDLKIAFLKLVYEHNNKRYQEIDARYEEISNNPLINYLNVLKNNGIKKELVDLNNVVRNSSEDLDKMLQILKAIISDMDAIIYIIENSDLVNVNYFKELKTKGVLNSSTFSKYPEIFIKDSELRKRLDENIGIMNQYGLDCTMFSKHSDILIENDNLKENLEILGDYYLIECLKPNRKNYFLKDKDIYKKIDKILELGYEDLLVQDITLLNEENWDRIYVLKNMGLQPFEKDELLKCLRDEKFFIPDNELYKYIENATKDQKELPATYDIGLFAFCNQLESARVIALNGVIISHNRMRRNIDDGDYMAWKKAVVSENNLFIKKSAANVYFNAMLKDAIYNVEEVKAIKAALKNKEYIYE